MGTPPFAGVVLDALLGSSHEVIGVVTQPDRPHGRGRKMEMSAVAQLAEAHGIEILKPVSRRDPEFLEGLRRWAPDVSVVAAFGLILSPEILAVPTKGSLNVHASLLPKFRGAAPIQDAIIKGERVTGVTTMLMDAGLDTGDILLQEEVLIAPDTTAGELEERLAEVGAGLLLKTLERLEAGTLLRRPQDGALAAYSPSLGPEAGYILWNDTAAEIHNRIRGCTPRPGARCFLRGAPVKIWRTRMPEGQQAGKEAQPGDVISAGRESITVTCSGGTSIDLLEVQPPGKGRMSAGDMVRGLRDYGGERLRFDTLAPEK